jgi:GcrA cell cycle regulator
MIWLERACGTWEQRLEGVAYPADMTIFDKFDRAGERTILTFSPGAHMVLRHRDSLAAAPAEVAIASPARRARNVETAMAWTDEQIEELKRLWNEGLSTAEIGRALNVSKNAVVGKSHRLGLKPRPSPIAGKKAEEVAAKKKPTAPVKQARPQERIGDVIDLGPNMCRWPFGDPGDADFHFCGKQTVPGKPYCAEHCAVAYVSKSNSRDRSSSSSSSFADRSN